MIIISLSDAHSFIHLFIHSIFSEGNSVPGTISGAGTKMMIKIPSLPLKNLLF